MKRIVSLLLIFGLLCLFACQSDPTPDLPHTDPVPDTENNSTTENPDNIPDSTPEQKPEPPSERTLRLQKLKDAGIPVPEEEFRGLWVAATDINAILKDTDADSARAAIDKLMDDCIENRLNTVVFHVRVNSDAYYLSDIFPYANGARTLLESGFDVLGYAVEAAHARGLDIHAWANPYRIGSNKDNARCDDYFKYGSYYYYVPTSPAVQSLIVSGMQEIIDNYKVDGLQYDDYFYTEGTVPDDAPARFEENYADYLSEGGTLSVGDWRRDAVNQLMKKTFEVAHSRRNCVFGISPAYDVEKNYREKYADVLHWMKNAGYIDYILPQIYFGFENSTAPFAETTALWMSYERAPSVSLYVGLALYKTGMKKDDYAGAGVQEWYENSDILKREVLCTRQALTNGFCLFRHAFFDPNMKRDSGYSKEIAAAEVENLKAFLS